MPGAGELGDIAAEAHLAVPRGAARSLLASAGLWEQCWPGLVLEGVEDRADKGVRWIVRGDLEGTAELWLEPWRDGCVAHVYLRPAAPPGTNRRRAVRRVRSYGHRTRALLFWAKDRLEGRRPMHPEPSGASAQVE